MTALNIWQDGRNAYLLTDTAIYDSANVVLRLEPKTIVLDGLIGGCRMALAATGHIPPALLVAALNERLLCDPRDVLKALPDVILDIERVTREQWGDQAPCEIGIVAAVYDPREAKPIIFMISNETGGFNCDQEPLKLYQIRYWTTGLMPFGPFKYDDPTASDTITGFDPHTDGLAMIEAQRKKANLFEGGSFIGGSAALVTIGPDGITRHILRDWGDEIGAVIRP